MSDILKKGIMLGIGIATLTEKEINKNIDELTRKGHIKANDAKKVAVQLLKEAKVQKQKLQKIAEEEAKKHIGKMDKKTKAEILMLKKKITELEKKLENKAVMYGRSAAKDFLKATETRKYKKDL